MNKQTKPKDGRQQNKSKLLGDTKQDRAFQAKHSLKKSLELN